MNRTTLGLIVGNRGFFPSHLCQSGRETVLRVLEEEGIQVVTLGPDDTEYGSIESLSDARKCGELFRQHAKDTEGVLVTLPNFGDERAVANAIRFSGLDVPVLVHAFPDDPQRMDIANRRDGFCGKMSVCNALRQYGIPFTVTGLHTVDPLSADFRSDLRTFVATCHVVRGMRRARVGLLGSRPAAFTTMRFSEKILEMEGISVETLDLYEAFGRADRLDSTDPAVAARRDALTAYARVQGVPDAALDKMARFGLVLERWMHDNELDATAIQCWMSMEEYFGIVPCAVMSMMSHGLLPNACESDVVGALSMLALQLASGTPSALVDWNNNYRDDPDKGVIFHCSNLPVDLFADQPRMTNHAILAGSTEPGKTYGTLVGRLEAQPFTYCRVSTDDVEGCMVGYVGEGELTSDPLDTFGAFGVIEIPDFQDLLQFICENGFEHHVAISGSHTADALDEAFNKYLGWDVYYHE